MTVWKSSQATLTVLFVTFSHECTVLPDAFTEDEDTFVSLSPAQLNFVMHLLEDCYMGDPGSCAALQQDLAVLCRDPSNAENLSDLGSNRIMWAVVKQHGWHPEACAAVLDTLWTSMRATGDGWMA